MLLLFIDSFLFGLYTFFCMTSSIFQCWWKFLIIDWIINNQKSTPTSINIQEARKIFHISPPKFQKLHIDIGQGLQYLLKILPAYIEYIEYLREYLEVDDYNIPTLPIYFTYNPTCIKGKTSWKAKHFKDG